MAKVSKAKTVLCEPVVVYDDEDTPALRVHRIEQARRKLQAVAAERGLAHHPENEYLDDWIRINDDMGKRASLARLYVRCWTPSNETAPGEGPGA